jgi:antitoxin component YwqK of YwqJK toxin-antitoxin module
MKTKLFIFFCLLSFSPVYSQQSAQTGCVSGDCQNGTGTFIDKDGNKYTGEFKNGLPNGQGTYIFMYPSGDPTGEKYEGGWSNGVWSGEGVHTLYGQKTYAKYTRGKPMNCKFKVLYKSGVTKESGVYIDSLLNGGDTVYYKSGKINYILNYKNDVLEGAYKEYSENGTLLADRIYKNGKLWTTIAEYFPDGKPTGGNIKDGNGVRIYQSNDGKTIYTSTYKDGDFVKTETIPAK